MWWVDDDPIGLCLDPPPPVAKNWAKFVSGVTSGRIPLAGAKTMTRKIRG